MAQDGLIAQWLGVEKCIGRGRKQSVLPLMTTCVHQLQLPIQMMIKMHLY
jgi:hypothetical protein